MHLISLLSEQEYDNQEGYKVPAWNKNSNLFKGKERFMRSFLYFALIKIGANWADLR